MDIEATKGIINQSCCNFSSKNIELTLLKYLMRIIYAEYYPDDSNNM